MHQVISFNLPEVEFKIVLPVMFKTVIMKTRSLTEETLHADNETCE